MGRWSIILVVTGILLFTASPIQADDHIKGRYLVTNYTARQYNAGTQNWDVVQDSKGVIYIANRNGVLTYDGHDWLLTPNSLETPLRSLAISEDDQVYVGSVGEFGVLEADSIGNPLYRLLSGDIDHIITDVWETHTTSSYVYFATRSKVYALNTLTDSLSTILSPQSGFQRSFKVYDKVLVGVTSNGLYQLESDSLVALPGFNDFGIEVINSVLEAPNLNGSEQGIYILTNSRKTFHYGLDTNQLRRMDTDAGDEFKIPVQTYRAKNLSNGSFIFATLSNGIVITDSLFNVKHVINRDHGLSVDMTLNVFEDRDGSVWGAMNNGLSRVDFQNNIIMWNTDSEFAGGVLSLTEYKGNLFIGTSSGLLKVETNSEGNPDALTEISGSTYQIFDMEVFKNRNAELLMIAGSTNLAYFDGTTTRSVIDESVFVIAQSERTPGRFFLGLRNGWAVLDVSANRNGRLSILDFRKLELPPFEFRSIEEDSTGGVWLGSRFNGVFYIPREAYETKSGELEPDLIKVLSQSSGLSSNSDNYVVKIGNEVALIASDGLFSLEVADSIQISEHSILGQVKLGNISQVSIVNDRQNFILSNGELYRFQVSEENGQISLTNVLPFLGQEPFSVMHLTNSNEVWVGSADALFKVNLESFPSYTEPFNTIIHSVYLSQDSLISRSLLGQSTILSIPYGQANVTFQYGSTRYIYGYTPRFESKLEGYDGNWSGWSVEKARTYTNLSNGRYTFLVRSIDPFGNISEVGRQVLIVETPWFKSILAYLFYGLLIIAITYGIVRFQTDRIARQNRLLEKKVIQRTAELQVEKRRLETMNDNLKALDENRDKFLSVVAHDLRNPLMIIRSSSDLIEEEIDDKKAILEFAGYIRDASLKMQSIIENLLEDRAKKIRFHDDMPNIDIKPIVAKICKENEIWAHSKNIKLNLDLQDGCVIKADAAQIGVIVDNLVSNAIKYSPHHKEVNISLIKSASGLIEIAIVDNGPGLLPSEIQKIGKPSMKLSAKPTGGEASSGMGLYIVKDLLQVNNGDLSVYSSGRGKGSTFKVLFPSTEL
jgi:signal transduction histidine kinase